MAKRILIADDSVTILKAFAMTFGAEGPDFAFTPARSADEGLNLARQTRPELVIADGSMSGRSGYELCQAIKTDPSLRGTAVYILASAQQPYDEARGRQAGADGHFVKPWDTGGLIEKVREAMARGADATPMPTPGIVTPPPVAQRPTVPPVQAVPPPQNDDEYGEIDVDEPPGTPAPTLAPVPAPRPVIVPAPPPAVAAAHAPTLHAAPSHAPVAPAPPRPVAPVAHPVAHPAAAAAHAPQAAPVPSGQSGVTMRPSLIPGVRPGAVPPARPGTTPVRPVGPSVPPGAMVPPRPAAVPAVGRTLVGLPAAGAPLPGSLRSAPMAAPAVAPSIVPPMSVPPISAPPVAAPAPAARPPSGPAAPLAARPAPAAAPAYAPAVAAAVSSAVDHQMAAVAARGPEYEAIAKLSREIIEQVVWEVVPELAEAIIREHMEKRGRV